MRGGQRLLRAARPQRRAARTHAHPALALRRPGAVGPALLQRRTRSTLAGAGRRAAQLASTAGNVLIIGSVLSLFGFIMYTLYDNLIAESGVTRVYNESLDLLRANPTIKALLGESIAGFGEPTHGQRQRQRAITHRNSVDAQGRQRLYMQYYVEDSRKQSPYVGVAKVDLAESKGTGSWDYNYIVVDLYLPGER
ncbi:mitochondrial import inner membrane translocase subunit tim21, partial [Coemansia nantahalensis]